ncbi:MAG: class I SAM-dependent methyltransferase, partial [Pseudomonadota bacterium]
MSFDPETIRVYDGAAETYRARFGEREASANLLAFAALLPAGGAVLDLGCGPGTSALHLQAQDFVVEGMDASSEMVAIARSAGISARQGAFEALDAVEAYDGVWANFSLLHAPRADLPDHFAAIRRALRPEGIFHIGMKIGTGHARDRLGRLYTYVGVEELSS